MSWLSDLFKKAKPKDNAKFDQAISMKGYEPRFTAFGNTILQSDIIYCAIMMKARWFGKLDPRHIRVRDGENEEIKDSSVARLLRCPNDFQSTYDFLTQAFFMREKDNQCFIYPDYRYTSNGSKEYIGMYVLLPIMPPLVIEDESGNLFLKFQFVNPAREVVFPMEEIVWWRKNIEDNQFMGGGKYASLSNKDLLSALETYHTSMEAVGEQSKLSCYFDGILKVNGFSASDDKIQKIRDKFIQDLRNNKSGIAVLDNGAEYQAIQRSLKMADSATLKEIKENVMLHCGMTLEMLMGKFTEEDKNAFYENIIEPSAISLGQAMSRVFFSQWQTSFGDQVVIYASKIELMSMTAKNQLVATTINAGVFTLDEIRAMYGFAPLPNGEGKLRPRGFNNLDGDIQDKIDIEKENGEG